MFEFPSHDHYRRMRGLLHAAEYTFDGLCRTLGGDDWFTPRAIDIPPLERRVRGGRPHDTLIRLFLLGEAVSREDACLALQPMDLEVWVQAGLVRASEATNQVTSAVRLTPVEDLIVAADAPRVDAGEAPADYVMPPGATSLQLGWSAIRRPSGGTLDLGAGCGYLGLMAAGHSQRVIATDFNRRAADLAWFNARLNGIESFESRAGNLFDPVVGERFDLILSNPPFVITPEQRLMFRDSGMRGDEFCRRLIQAAPQHLNDGGYCQLLANFAHRRQRPWQQDLTAWFHGLGCNVLVLITRQQPIEQYAMSWITSTESQDPAQVPRLFDRWMAYYEAEQIEQVSFLHITMCQRNSGPHWIRVDEDPVVIAGHCGDAILHRMAIMDYLIRLPADEALLDERLLVHPDARLVQEHTIQPDGPQVAANRLEMRGGLRHTAQLDVHVTRLLAFCDGQHPLRELLAAMAETLNMDIDRVTRIALPAVKHLLERGILTPPGLLDQGG